MFAHVTCFDSEPCDFWAHVEQRSDDLDWWFISLWGALPNETQGSYLFHSGRNGEGQLSDVYELYDLEDPDLPDWVLVEIMKHALCPGS